MKGYRIVNEYDLPFINGEITETEYLLSLGICHDQYHVSINLDGNVEVWIGWSKTPPWLRKKARQRKLPQYKKWRTDVFKRDNYTCQDCGKHGVKLNAHHKKQYSDFPELRFDVDNGITLCESCHKLRHAKAVNGNGNLHSNQPETG